MNDVYREKLRLELKLCESIKYNYKNQQRHFKHFQAFLFVRRRLKQLLEKENLSKQELLIQHDELNKALKKFCHEIQHILRFGFWLSLSVTLLSCCSRIWILNKELKLFIESQDNGHDNSLIQNNPKLSNPCKKRKYKPVALGSTFDLLEPKKTKKQKP